MFRPASGGSSSTKDQHTVERNCIGFSGRGEVSGLHVLLAVGRCPNTDDLGLTEADIAVDKRGLHCRWMTSCTRASRESGR